MDSRCSYLSSSALFHSMPPISPSFELSSLKPQQLPWSEVEVGHGGWSFSRCFFALDASLVLALSLLLCYLHSKSTLIPLNQNLVIVVVGRLNMST